MNSSATAAAPLVPVFFPVLLPLLGAGLAFVAKAFFHGRPGRFLEGLGATLGLFLPLGLLFLLLPDLLAGQVYRGIVAAWHEGVGIAYRFDGLAWLVNVLGFTVASAAWVYSLSAGPRGPRFTAIFLIQTAALAATAMTADLFNLFVCLEVLGLASYILVSSSGKPGAYLASFSYLMVSAAAMIFFLLGLYGFYRLTGALSYQGIAAGLRSLPHDGGAAALVSLALVTAAVALRVAVMPLYGWLPDAHAKAPHAISAVLSGVLIKTPLFALARILMLFPAGDGAGQLLGYAGGITALAAVIIALSQRDAKKLLAYHSVSQIGYVVCAWGAALQAGMATKQGLLLMTAAFLHALYHALFKGLLFLTVGTVTDAAGQRDVYQLRGGTGLLRRGGEILPITTLAFLLAAMAITALPPLNGFASKAALSYALKGRWEYWLLTLASVGTAASFIKLSRIFLPARKGRKAASPEEAVPLPEESRSVQQRSGIGRQLAEFFLAALCVATGLFSPVMARLTARLLDSAGHAVSFTSLPPQLYASDTLIKTALLTAGGLILFLAAGTAPGHVLLGRIRNRPRSFQGLFVSLSLGMAGMAAWLVWQVL